MTRISKEQFEQDPKELLERLRLGETIAIEADGKAIGKIVPFVEPAVDGKRTFGSMAGQFTVPENFNEMMREEIEEMFYGKP